MLILMTYMGHQSIAATNKYVRIVETMFPEIVRQVDMAHNHIFQTWMNDRLIMY